METLRVEMFFSRKNKENIDGFCVKQDLRYEMIVEEMLQREENVSARNMCCEESCSNDHMWTFQALNQQELNSRFFSNILANIIFTGIILYKERIEVNLNHLVMGQSENILRLSIDTQEWR